MTYIINDNGVQRQMNTKEIETYDQACKEIIGDAEALEAQQKAVAKAKQVVLEKLGLTAEEVAALLS